MAIDGVATGGGAMGVAAAGGGEGGGCGCGGGGGVTGAGSAAGESSRGVVVSWRDGAVCLATQAPSRNSCQGKQRLSWSDCAEPEGGASSAPQIEIATTVRGRATTETRSHP